MKNLKHDAYNQRGQTGALHGFLVRMLHFLGNFTSPHNLLKLKIKFFNTFNLSQPFRSSWLFFAFDHDIGVSMMIKEPMNMVAGTLESPKYTFIHKGACLLCHSSPDLQRTSLWLQKVERECSQIHDARLELSLTGNNLTVCKNIFRTH